MDREQRAEQMEEMYRKGMTLAQVGSEFNVSHERVRQILKQRGVPSNSGGMMKRARIRREKARQEKERRVMERFGCTLEQYEYLRSLDKEWAKTPIGRYVVQRKNARARGIAWKMTLWDWWGVWARSGKWEERGREDGQYVMCRRGDSGPYQVGNVEIKTCNDNADDHWYGASGGGVYCRPDTVRMCMSPERILQELEKLD